MANQYDKSVILNKFKQAAQSKGFNLNVKKGEGEGIATTTPTLTDLLDGIAEAISVLLSEEQNRSAILKAKDIKIGPSGQQKGAAYKGATVKADSTTDPKFFAWIEQFHGLLQAVYPEPGFGAPNVFATALKTLLASKPTSITAKVTDGSGKVKITI